MSTPTGSAQVRFRASLSDFPLFWPLTHLTECKSLLQRMLVTNPQFRASLTEVMSHPWMTKGFDGPPDAHLIQREPLRLDELDPVVIEGMTGFEFGTRDEIESRLREVLDSEDYRKAVTDWKARKAAGRGGQLGWRPHGVGPTPSSSSLSAASLVSESDESDRRSGAASPSKKGSKRFSGFDFYRKKLFSSSPKEEKSPSQAFPPTNGAHVNGHTGIGSPSFETIREPLDPTRGFHPLISIYYLVREKLERDRVYGPGHFASSELSIVPTSADIYSQQPSQLPVVSSAPPVPPSPNRPVAPDYSMPLPRLPLPASSLASSTSRASPVDPPSSRFGPTSATPRTRALIDDPPIAEPSPVMKHPELDDGHARLAGPAANAIALPRAPDVATHRRSHSLSQGPSPTTRAHSDGLSPNITAPPPSASERPASFELALAVQPQISPPPRENAPLHAIAPLPVTAEAAEEIEPLSPPPATASSPDGPWTDKTPSLHFSTGSIFSKRFSSILGSKPVEEGAKKANKRQSLTLPRSFSRTMPTEPEAERSPSPTEAPSAEALPPLPTSQSQPTAAGGAFHKRASTVMESPNRRGEARRSSAGGSVSRSATTSSTSGRRVPGIGRPSAGTNGTAGERGVSGPATGLAEWGVGEEPVEVAAIGDSRPEHGAIPAASTAFKPIYLKGLFRYVILL